MNPSIVGIYSPSSGHGKDTVAKLFLNNTLNVPEEYMLNFKELLANYRTDIFMYSPWVVKKFAHGPKQIVADIYNVSVDKLEDREWRSKLVEPYPITPLQMVIKVAELLRAEVSQTIWSDQLFNTYTPHSKWLITDLRFPYEYDAIKSRGGIVIRVTNPNCQEPKQAMDGFLDDKEFDEEIINVHGDYKSMIWKVKDIVKKYNMVIDGGENGKNIIQENLAADSSGE